LGFCLQLKTPSN
jgi:hypothetical protein